IQDYIRNSGDQDYPFTDQGRVLRVATPEDLQKQKEIEGRVPALIRETRQRATEKHGLDMKVVDVEPILGGELLTVYYVADDRVDFRSLVSDLASTHQTRIDMRHVGARDEARLVADYEKCGQHCCCKQFLKVLKPVSMKAAKMQKATLDPQKISGRCGRLMCCLRYEQESYEELKKKLPHRRTRVGTPEGPGLVIDTQILTQLVLVELEEDRRKVAVTVDDLCDPEACPPREEIQQTEPLVGRYPTDPGGDPEISAQRGRDRQARDEQRGEGRKKRRKRSSRKRGAGQTPAAGDKSDAFPKAGAGAPETGDQQGAATTKKKKKRRRRKKKTGSNAQAQKPDTGTGNASAGEANTPAAISESSGEQKTGEAGAHKRRPHKKRRKRKPRRGHKPGHDG
ncbi:MAG TPA: hypothetical protein ENJ06_02480, partial [Phycisphaeraceae bacterium]|nr:hypothetical protein [Phycisphaeraceae bacterium]